MSDKVQFESIAEMSFNPLHNIGAILDGAMDDVEKVLNDVASKTAHAASTVITEAGEQAMRAIASLKGAYVDSLEVSYEKADSSLKRNIDQVNDLVAAIVSQDQAALVKVADQIQDIIKLSPLCNAWVPLLSSTTPSYAALDADPKDLTKALVTKVMVRFTGNFAYADQPGYRPSFVVGDKEYAPIANSSRQLKFMVDISSDNPKIHVRKFSYIRGSLSVIWNNGWLSLPWSKKTSTYRILLGILPASPGIVKIIYAKPAWDLTKIENEKVRQMTHDKGRERADTIVNLRWGSSVAAKPQAGEFIKGINFTAFNGDTILFQPQADQTNPFITLTELDDTIQVAAKKSSDLDHEVVSALTAVSKVRAASFSSSLSAIPTEEEKSAAS